MKKIDKLKKYLRILILLLIIVIIVYIFLIVLPSKDKNKEEKKMDNTKYGYILRKKDNELYKEIFNDLKEILETSSIDYNKYAEDISKLFIIDLYTLSNKSNKNDIGGIQFVLESVKENYRLNVSDTLYKYIGMLNEYPEVKSIEILENDKINYILNDKEYSAYQIKLKWEYVKDLEYEKEGTVIVIQDGEKLYVVEKK